MSAEAHLPPKPPTQSAPSSAPPHVANSTLSLRSLPYLDEKWLRADLYAALQSTEDLAHLWNNLVKDQELYDGPTHGVHAGAVNAAGHVAYVSPTTGRHYCGAQRLSCGCCTGFCRPGAACNCVACEQLDNEQPEVSASKTRHHQHHQHHSSHVFGSSNAGRDKATSGNDYESTAATPSDAILNSWLWGPIPSTEEQVACIRALLAEQRDITLKAAAHSLSALHLRQRLFVYQRYFTALTRVRSGASNADENAAEERARSSTSNIPGALQSPAAAVNGGQCTKNNHNNTNAETKFGASATSSAVAAATSTERATLGLARVGTRAALNFSFAFLRRAWRSGEDTDLCSELLAEALEALQDLPEASLFETGAVSALWLEVLERSVKFLRQVVLGDVMGGRCLVPRPDRHIALNLLLELGVQKGTLSATLELIVLLLTIWEKDRHEVEDNRAPTLAASAGRVAAAGAAPLVSVLRKYAEITTVQQGGEKASGSERNANECNGSNSNSPTKTYLADVHLPAIDDINAAVDLKQAAVMMACHLDRVVQAHLPIGGAAGVGSLRTAATKQSTTTAAQTTAAKHQVFLLGCASGLVDRHGFTAPLNPALDWPLLGDVEQQYCGSMVADLDAGGVGVGVQQVVCAADGTVYVLNEHGEVWCLAAPDSHQPQHQHHHQQHPQLFAAGAATGSAASPTSSTHGGYGGAAAGVGNSEQRSRRLLSDFGGAAVLQLAGHCEGKHMLALTADRYVYSWGIGDGGRLGHGDSAPRLNPTRVQYFEEQHAIVRVFAGAAYSAAVSAAGVLYTWGRGFYGALGHGTSEDRHVPTMVQALCCHTVCDVALGSGDSHSLCVTTDGQVWAWGDNDFGKLGTGNCHGSHVPVLVDGLQGVVRVWSGSQFSVALTGRGEVYTWGKSHGGRLGHEGAGAADALTGSTNTSCASPGGAGDGSAKIPPEFCSVPRRVEALCGHNIVQVAVGSAHCLGRSAQGEVFGWGRNDFHQICPPTVCRDSVIRTPVQTTPQTMRMAGVACGAAQSVLWRETQQFGLAARVPFVVDLSEAAFRNIDQLLGMAMGPVVMSATTTTTGGSAASAAATSVNGGVGGGVAGTNPSGGAQPSIETECIAVACLNVLRLQLHALLANQVAPSECGLAEGSRLLGSLKTRLLALAGGASVHRTIQEAAQWTLQVGWIVFLPTAAERAHTLTALLPAEPGGVQSTAGHRFMTDLLVSSLMAEEGLETALWQAIHVEPEPESEEASAHNLPLLHLIKQLLRNNSALTQARLAHIGAEVTKATGGGGGAAQHSWRKSDADETEAAAAASVVAAAAVCANGSTTTSTTVMPSPSLDLLHRFQRLLLSHIQQQAPSAVAQRRHQQQRQQHQQQQQQHNHTDESVRGAEALLGKYMHHLIGQCVQTLTKAHEVASEAAVGAAGAAYADAIADVLSMDISNTLLLELLIGLILLHQDRQALGLAAFNWTKHFLPLLGILDHLNRVIGEPDVQDSDDLGWPAIICRSPSARAGGASGTAAYSNASVEETSLFRQSDLDNHIAAGGRWIVVNGFVCDVQDYQCESPAIAELIATHLGTDISAELQARSARHIADTLCTRHKIGKFAFNDSDEKQPHPPGAQLTHLQSERALGYLMGLRSVLLQRGTPLQPDELQCRSWLRSPMLSGGLQVLQPSNPFDEEKGEARSSASTAGSTPTETSMHVMMMPPQMAHGEQHHGNLLQQPSTMHHQQQPVRWPHMLVTHRIDALLTGLGEARLTDPVVSTWLCIAERYCKQNNLIWHQDFPPDHPISDLERHLTAVFIHHQSIGALVLAVIDRELSGSVNRLPTPVANIIKLVHSTKWTLIRTRQQLNRSYKEVCTPMLEKCRFLLYEVRPVFSNEQSGLQRLNIVHKVPRFRQLVRRIIAEIRTARKASDSAEIIAKPDDILNVTIQSQSLQKNVSNESLRMSASLTSTGSAAVVVPKRVGGGSSVEDLLGAVPKQHRSTESLITAQQQQQQCGVSVGGAGDNDSNMLSEKQVTADIGTDTIDPNTKPSGATSGHRTKSMDSDEQFINNVIARLSEKCIRHIDHGPPVATVMSLIVDFVLQDAGDVETLRRAMYCQVQRYHTRRMGLEMFSELLDMGGLLEAVQYSVLSGYMGVFVEPRQRNEFVGNVLDDLNVVTAFQKADLILAHSRVIEWAVREMQRFAGQDAPTTSVLLQQQKQQTVLAGSGGIGLGKLKCHAHGKDMENLGTYAFLKKLPRARFLLSVFGILARDLGPNEISLVVDSGAMGCILGLLRQTGGDGAATSVLSNDLTYVFEDTISKKPVSTNVAGAELAKLMKIGTKVVRGADWKWGDQDGPPPGEGRIISEVGEDGWVRVEWDNGATNSYRMGKEGQYDLRLADTFTLVSPDTETEIEENTSMCESTIQPGSHPTKLLRNACTKLLKIFSVSVGRHANKMSATAVRSFAAMFRAILTGPKSSSQGIACGQHLGLETWTTLGFLRAISSARSFATCLTTRAWFDLHIIILQTPTSCEADVYKKLQSLRLLQATLETWQQQSSSSSDDMAAASATAHPNNCVGGVAIADIVERLFRVLGTVVMQCPSDLSLAQNPADMRARVLLTCAHSGTVAEEIVALLRKLHATHTWNGTINAYCAQKLYMAAEMMGEMVAKCGGGDDADVASVLAVLTLIGGCDPRPRVGLTIVHENQSSTVTNFTSKGKAMLSVHNSSEVKKLPVLTLRDAVEAFGTAASMFSIARLPFNEMLLNSWSILLTGPGQWMTNVPVSLQGGVDGPSRIDAALLRAQQIHLGALNATSVLFRQQITLRRILRQRSGATTAAGLLSRLASSSEESISEHDNGLVDELLSAAAHQTHKHYDHSAGAGSSSLASPGMGTLIETILTRATQTNPLKALYSYAELSMAALNLTQHLASTVHNERSPAHGESAGGRVVAPLPAQPTLVHGVPVYYEKQRKGAGAASSDVASGGRKSTLTSGATGSTATANGLPSGTVALVMEMGFPQMAVELAIRRLALDATLTNIAPTVEQIVQWMLEHPDACLTKEAAAEPAAIGGSRGATALGAARLNDYDADSDSDSAASNYAQDGARGDASRSSATSSGGPSPYQRSGDFETADQYAMYVRGLVCAGMLVKCCRDFEEIRRGDIGHVLRVDTEGLHDLNVQVDWQMHAATYWMRFVHVELLEPPASSSEPSAAASADLAAAESAEIRIGSHVRIRPNVTIPCYKWGSVTHGSIGVVTAIDDRDVTVDFPQQFSWTGQLSEMELVCQANPEALAQQQQLQQQQLSAGGAAARGPQAMHAQSADGVGELIEDWSRCIHSLTVSSNETTARHLLDTTTSCWQSSNRASILPPLFGHCNPAAVGRHWIRLQIHENVLIHSLAIVVSPQDGSHQPALVVVRVGDSIETTKDFGWVSVKPTDSHVQLLSDMRQYHRCVEIVVKQCRNNGIHCRVQGVQIAGRRRQTDVELMLMNASFLSTEFDYLRETSGGGAYAMPLASATSLPAAGSSTATGSVTSYASYADVDSSTASGSGAGGNGSTGNDCKVLVWGLNDKEQLGGLKGSKIKIPTLSATLSQLRPVHLSGGSKSLFVVSQDGKVYACGEGTNGRLGLGHNYNVSEPRMLSVLSQYVVKKVAVHSGGKHAMALTLDGKVFSWGEGEDGKLGHGTRITLDKPKLIEALRSKRIRDIACGSSHSAAITSAGELYTWGLGEYGRLGHGDNATQLKPRLVSALLDYRVVQVACGSRDAQTLALTEEGFVFSWGDGDFGKLGRGGSEGCSVPHQVERLNGIGVVQIECGAQFSLALSKAGEVWTWGKGDYYRLGHGSDQHVRKPTPIHGLRGKRVIHVAVGALHCLAVTETGQVFAWGDNDHGQQGSGTTVVNKKPVSVVGLDNVFVNRVACGSSHSVAWSLPQSAAEGDKKEPVPFALPKDPLGGSSLGFYDAELKVTAGAAAAAVAAALAQAGGGAATGKAVKATLSDVLLSLESRAARQMALNFVLNAMSIVQARQCIVAALTSHSQLASTFEKISDSEHYFKELEELHSPQHSGGGGGAAGAAGTAAAGSSGTGGNAAASGAHRHLDRGDVIAQGGGEALADVSALIVQDQPSTPDSDCPPAAMPIVTASAIHAAQFQSLTGSTSLSTSVSSVNARQSKMSVSAMSVMAATMTHQDEVINDTDVIGLDEFTALLGESEAKSLVELLKLSVAGRTGGPATTQTIASTLIALGIHSAVIGGMLLETCITELEDLCTSRHFLGKLPKPVVQETSHPYIDDITLVGHVRIPGAESLRIEFDSQCSTEKRNDPLIIMDGAGRVIATRSGREYAQWTPEIKIAGDEMRWKFTSDSSVNGWGWKFWVHAVMPPFFLQELGADRAVLSQPSMDLVMALLDSRIMPQSSSILLRLAAALAACSQLNTLTTAQRIWAVRKLDAILKSRHSPGPLDATINAFLMPLIPALLKQYEYEESLVRTGVHLMHSEYFKTLAALVCDMRLDTLLPSAELHKWAWFRRYCAAVRVAQSLVHRTALPRAFVTEVRKKIGDMMPTSSGASKMVVAQLSVASGSLTLAEVVSSSSSSSTVAPSMFATSVAAGPLGASALPFSASSVDHYIDALASSTSEDASHLMADVAIAAGATTTTIAECPANAPTSAAALFIHEDQNVFKTQHDRQLLQWLNRRPEDWALSWGGASTIYGWGHNHRGQLGGLEGGRIKTPTPCESLSLLRPIQLCGGEQTLYAVTADGKLFATGYGAGGRLGIGGMDSVSTPILVESLQHVFVKKVAVNSGGKHCLALTADGEVYSWGEGEDGKLGHGNRQNCDRPKLIEALSGIGVVDVACGSAHSACITAAGNVMTWGKGRYGRLGHGDSEDHLRPKLVEAVLGYRAIDIACGSGDAQTICITDDDNVWSWGDGDYGKLGRGGSDGCKYPAKIESLAGLGVLKVECGSQFSVALTRSGAVYTWGKGDYHRLGHGSVEHVRRPRKVAALQGKKIVSIATGSLHCVACSDTGEVYTWGDNDEGQLGDGTVSAVQRPRVVQALQGKHIVKVTCGSAHTLALSTTQMSEGARPPPNPPLEYDFVRDLPLEALHSRLVLLHHFSELLCPCLAMLPMAGADLSLGALKDVLVYSIKEAAFRKVIQMTMVRDKQHGPVIELNRIQVKRARTRANGGLAGVDGMKSVFGQMVQKLPLLNQEALYLPHRVWKVKFVGESVDDCGGGFSESIAEMCDELQNGAVPLLIQTPNGRGEAGTNRDCFLLDPTLTSVLQMNMFRFLGVLMGIAVRTGSPLSLNLAEPVWRQLTGETLRPSDLTEVDRDYVASLICIRDMEDDPRVFQTLELPFSTPSAKGHEVPMSTRYTRITQQNKHEYVRLALNYRLHEFDEQVKAVRDGMSKVIPVPLLSLFSAAQLQAMVCGSPEIPLALLKSVATYKGIEPTSALVAWFWEVMEEFSNQERSLFLRFVWGRTRLPRTIADFRGRDFVLQVLDKYNPPDHFLPESYTCFFLLKMPRYSCKAILLEKLKYAIYFCKSIDTDEYARVAMVEPIETTISDNNSDVDSEISEEM